ncbi:MAG: NADH-ubiquinone oxidoreductase-F iron-sulfur binding region domain-containing protein [Acidimicrobiia bacterium]
MTTNVTRQSTPKPGAPPEGLPRVLVRGASTYGEHVARYGPLPDLHKRSVRAAFIDMVDRSALRGRGGAGFPTGRKLRAVADGGRGAVVVANGAEGEPASRKDSLLMSAVPHLVIDGAVIAAHAVRAREAFVVVDRADTIASDALTAAIGQRTVMEPGSPTLKLVRIPSRYVAGEESATVNFLNGGPAKPTFVPPRPYERGVHGRPTLVQNVETLANLALIARYGAEWYHAVGTPDEPGGVLVTLSGAVAHPGVYEFALGTPMATILESAGKTAEPISALLVGGYFGSWLDVAALPELALTHAGLRQAGGTLGCGVIHAFPSGRCGVIESARIVRYLAEETAGQCGPCVNGLGAIAGGVEALARGKVAKGTRDDVTRWLGDVAQRGACHLPDAAVGFVRSAFEVFADEFARHERGSCTATDATPSLPIPNPASRDWSWR